MSRRPPIGRLSDRDPLVLVKVVVLLLNSDYRDHGVVVPSSPTPQRYWATSGKHQSRHLYRVPWTGSPSTSFSEVAEEQRPRSQRSPSPYSFPWSRGVSGKGPRFDEPKRYIPDYTRDTLYTPVLPSATILPRRGRREECQRNSFSEDEERREFPGLS